MTYVSYTYGVNTKRNATVREQLKCINACHPCCKFTSIFRPILAAIAVIFFILFGVMPKMYGFAIVGGVAAGILVYTIIFGAAFGASVGCKYIWCACLFKQEDLLETLPKIISKNQLMTIAVEDIEDIETKKQAMSRLYKIRCYDCCKITSILRIVALAIIPTFFPIAFCVPRINEPLKWTLVGIASAAGVYLFYSSIFGLAFSPMFGCNMKYSCCTFCEPKDTAFESDYKQYLNLESISLLNNKPAPKVQVTNVPQLPTYAQTVPTPPVFAPNTEQVMPQPAPVDIKFQMVI